MYAGLFYHIGGSLMTLTHTSALPPPRGQSRQFHPGLAPGPPLVESVRQLLLKERERHGERGGGREKERKREREMQTAWHLCNLLLTAPLLVV